MKGSAALLLSALVGTAGVLITPSIISAEEKDYAEVILRPLSKDYAEDVPRLLKDLNSQDPGTREFAVECLGNTRNQKLVKNILPLLRDKDVGVRCAAIDALEMIGDKHVMSSLVQAVRADPDPEVRCSAASALASVCGKDAIEPLLDVIRSKDYRVFGAAFNAIALIADSVFLLKKPFDILYARITDKTEETKVRIYASVPCQREIALSPVFSVATSAQVNIAQFLLGVFTNESLDPETRCEALIPLSCVYDLPTFRPFLKPLRNALSDKNPLIRNAAARAVGHLMEDDAIPSLILLLEDQDKRVKEGATYALKKITMEQFDNKTAWDGWFKSQGSKFDFVEARLSKLRNFGTREAILAKEKGITIDRWHELFGSGDPRATQFLLEKLRIWLKIKDIPKKDNTDRFAKMALEALCEMGLRGFAHGTLKTDEAFPVLLAIFNDKKVFPGVRKDALIGLARGADDCAVDILIKSLSAEEPAIINTALILLRNLSGKDFGKDQKAWEKWQRKNRKK